MVLLSKPNKVSIYWKSVVPVACMLHWSCRLSCLGFVCQCVSCLRGSRLAPYQLWSTAWHCLQCCCTLCRVYSIWVHHCLDQVCLQQGLTVLVSLLHLIYSVDIVFVAGLHGSVVFGVHETFGNLRRPFSRAAISVWLVQFWPRTSGLICCQLSN